MKPSNLKLLRRNVAAEPDPTLDDIISDIEEISVQIKNQTETTKTFLDISRIMVDTVLGGISRGEELQSVKDKARGYNKIAAAILVDKDYYQCDLWRKLNKFLTLQPDLSIIADKVEQYAKLAIVTEDHPPKNVRSESLTRLSDTATTASKKSVRFSPSS